MLFSSGCSGNIGAAVANKYISPLPLYYGLSFVKEESY